MTKRKTAKIKDLKPVSISEDQLKEIQTMVQQMNNAQMEIGRIETRKHIINHEFTLMEGNMRKKQTELQEQYGEVNINIQDGTITYPEDEQADKKD